MVQVIPVIDLMRGQVVRGVRGERHAYEPIVSRLVDGCVPCEIARALLAVVPPPPGGNAVLYVADLDAIQGGSCQVAALRELLQMRPDLTLWLDAGFSGAAAARTLARLLGTEAQRVRPVFGSESLSETRAVAELARDPVAILSLDSRQEQPLDPAGCWRRPKAWPRTVIVMTLDRVGAGAGPDLASFARLRTMAPDRTWIGAGGVRNRDDLRAAAEAGAEGWLVASALHDGMLP
jgi:phosphoribosylformimino-5-aminoimidazole carboxamide ribotide isomerase